MTDVITDLTIDTIEEVRESDQPFFIMLHHKASHAPFSPARRHSQAFDDRKVPIPETLFDDYEGKSRTAHEYSRWGSQPEERRSQYQQFMNQYLETVLGIDENVGRLLDYLDRSGLADNTVVIYTTDNGYFLGDHGYLDKRIMYEDAIQIPLLVRYPPEIPSKTVNDDIVLNLDFPETFLDYAGAEIPAEMQGRSLRPLLQENTVPDWRESMYYHFYEVDGPGNVEKHYRVRTERYKLIYFYNLDPVDQPWEMYDLEKDPFEMHNIYNVESYTDVRHALKQELKRLRNYYEDDTGEALPRLTGHREAETSQPDRVQLHANTPNPFNPVTYIGYELPGKTRVELSVYNLTGRKLETLVSEVQGAGSYSVRFDVDSYASGLYIYTLKTENRTISKKMTL